MEFAEFDAMRVLRVGQCSHFDFGDQKLGLGES